MVSIAVSFQVMQNGANKFRAKLLESENAELATA